MLLPPFFWQDVANSSKEMFVEHFLLRKKWETRFKDYILVVITMGIFITYGKTQAYLAYICFPESNPTNPNPPLPVSVLWIWVLLTIFVCATAESMSILDCVYTKMKRKRRFRVQQQQAKKSTNQTQAA